MIVSGGAINSPQLLMLSGVGPADQLRAHGIPLVHELPGVGQHLLDHLAVVSIVACNEPVTLAAAQSFRNVGRFLLSGRGMLTSNVAEACAFVRSRDGLPAPDLELVFAPVTFLDHGLEAPTGHGLTIGAVALQPQSVGTLTLESADPSSPPRIDPAYLSDDAGEDLRVLVEGMRRAREIFAAPVSRGMPARRRTRRRSPRTTPRRRSTYGATPSRCTTPSARARWGTVPTRWSTPASGCTASSSSGSSTPP